VPNPGGGLVELGTVNTGQLVPSESSGRLNTSVVVDAVV
jgi:hypothetical protein